MTDRGSAQPGPVRLTENSRVAFRPASHGSISGGLWAERRRVNRDVSVPEGWDHLHEAGNFHNLELAAGLTTGEYVNDLPFLDSDVYKWLEALGWALADPELTDAAGAKLQEFLDTSYLLLARVQEQDGYLDSHFQVRFPGERFQQLQWGHELYCIGHLIQAAVALHRTSGDERLLDLAGKAADLVTRSFGSEGDQIDGVCGHPEIETALVELFRETGERATSPRRSTSSTAAAAACSARTVSARRTGRITGRSARRRRPKAIRFVSCTCSPASPTCIPKPAMTASGRPPSGCGVRWSRPRPTSPAASVPITPTRRSATRTNCPMSAATARPAPRSRR
jgi:hypothetical protein